MTDVWYVYILHSAALDRLYTGITRDVVVRLSEHNGSKRGAKATRAGRPWKLVYRETHASKGDALRRELEIKAMSRPEKNALVKRRNA